MLFLGVALQWSFSSLDTRLLLSFLTCMHILVASSSSLTGNGLGFERSLFLLSLCLHFLYFFFSYFLFFSCNCIVVSCLFACRRVYVSNRDFGRYRVHSSVMDEWFISIPAIAEGSLAIDDMEGYESDIRHFFLFSLSKGRCQTWSTYTCECLCWGLQMARVLHRELCKGECLKKYVSNQ